MLITDLFNIPGYSLVEKHRKNGRGGGVCIFVKSGLRYKTREDISVFEEGTFESIFIELLDSKTVAGEVYRVPGTNLRLFMETYERVVKALANELKSVVIGTDQNIDLLRAGDHSGTADFINMNFSYGLAPTVTKPTRVTHSSATLIDNFYVTSDSLVNSVSKIIQCDLSDHFPILLLMSGENCMKRQPLRFKARKVDDLAITKMKTKLRNYDWNNFESLSVDQCFETIQTVIKNTLEQYAPEKEITISYKHVIKEPWMTKGLFKSSRKKNQYYRQSLHKPPKHVARLRYIHYRNVYNRLKMKAKKEYYHHKLNLYKNDI